VLALHPDWTPDQVKGALMVTAVRPAGITDWSIGVGEADAAAAAALDSPPAANAALDAFVGNDPVHGLGFDAPAWLAAATADASWANASWSDASWADASWSDASWSDASWADASWADASWADGADVDGVGPVPLATPADRAVLTG
jgi:hypothetical protein